MRGRWKTWEPGDPVTVNRIVWDQSEVGQLQDVLDNDWFGPGPKVQKFANSISDFTGIDLVQPVNSGSSALTLAIDSMMELGHWQPGDSILHPLCTFPTSINPAIKAGLRPVFVDVDKNTYQIDLKMAEKAVREYGTKIQGAIIPHLLGNICDMDWLLDILGGRPLVEDCCDTMGGRFAGHHVGGIGDVGCFSFYGSHHVTTAGVGGALATNREDIYQYAQSVTHWGRTDYSQITDIYEAFEKRYWYDQVGNDYQMTELQAAFGIPQLARVKAANKKRMARFVQLDQYFIGNGLDKYFYIPYTDCEDSIPSWFAYPLTIKGDAPFDRREFATFLIANKIEIRPMFTGNILKHPAYQRLQSWQCKLHGESRNADLIGTNGLFLPAWGMDDEPMAYMLSVLDKFFEAKLKGG